MLDRLSSVYMNAVKNVTGGEVISSFSLNYPSSWWGALNSITPMVIQDKRYGP